MENLNFQPSQVPSIEFELFMSVMIRRGFSNLIQAVWWLLHVTLYSSSPSIKCLRKKGAKKPRNSQIPKARSGKKETYNLIGSGVFRFEDVHLDSRGFDFMPKSLFFIQNWFISVQAIFLGYSSKGILTFQALSLNVNLYGFNFPYAFLFTAL